MRSIFIYLALIYIVLAISYLIWLDHKHIIWRIKNIMTWQDQLKQDAKTLTEKVSSLESTINAENTRSQIRYQALEALLQEAKLANKNAEIDLSPIINQVQLLIDSENTVAVEEDETVESESEETEEAETVEVTDETEPPK